MHNIEKIYVQFFGKDLHFSSYFVNIILIKVGDSPKSKRRRSGMITFLICVVLLIVGYMTYGKFVDKVFASTNG